LILKSLELDQDNLDSRIKLVNERARLEIESVKELSKDLIQETELTNIVINLIIDNAAKEKQRINEEYALRSIQIFNDANNAEVFNRELTNQRLENALFETVNLYEGTAKFADIFIGKLSKRMSDQMMEQFEALNDFRDLYKERYEVVENAIDMELNLLDGYFRIGLIDYETYVGELNRLDQERINNKSRLVQQNIALDRLEVDSRRISADESIRIAENLAGFLSAIAGESKALQIASALTEAAVAIARIITDTQRAIVAFSASVAPLGPAGLKMAAGYAIKAKISAGLSIATITAQAIGKLKGIQGQGSGSDGNAGGGRQSNNLGRGYADGGLVTGPGTSRSDSIPARLSNGEFVMNGASTAMFLPMLEMLNNAGRQTSVPSLMTTLPDAPESNNKSEMIVKTYVVESDLTSTQHKQARLKNLSTL
jgi:hypothetical protein